METASDRYWIEVTVQGGPRHGQKDHIRSLDYGAFYASRPLQPCVDFPTVLSDPPVVSAGMFSHEETQRIVRFYEQRFGWKARVIPVPEPAD